MPGYQDEHQCTLQDPPRSGTRWSGEREILPAFEMTGQRIYQFNDRSVTEIAKVFNLNDGAVHLHQQRLT